MLALAGIFAACTPTATPTRFFGASVNAGPTLDSVIVEFNLWDASDRVTTAAGVLSVDVKRPGESAILCHGEREVTRSDFASPDYRPHLEVRWQARCPPMAPGERRLIAPRFVPTGGVEIETWSKEAWKDLFDARVEPEVAQSTFVKIDPWLIVVDPVGPVRELTRPGPPDVNLSGEYASADPADTGAMTLRTEGCSARFLKPAVLAIRTSGVRALSNVSWDGQYPDGTHAKSMLGQVGARFSVDEVTPEKWRLHYTIPAATQTDYYGNAYAIAASPRWSILYGLLDDGQIYLCRGEYDTPEQEACGAALCASMRLPI